MELSIPVPVPELPNVIPAHPCQATAQPVRGELNFWPFSHFECKFPIIFFNEIGAKKLSPAANKFGEDLVNEEDNESTGKDQPEE